MSSVDTYFVSILERTVKAKFPTISRFEVDWSGENVRPVVYDDGRAELREYPPVAKWRIGNTRFSYVGKPTFKRISGVWWLPNSGRTIADYNDDTDNLFQVIQWTVEGKTAEEINRLLGNEKMNKY